MSHAELRKLRKKLRQIEKLERTYRELTEEEKSKVNSKNDIRSQLLQLAAGSVDESTTSVLEESLPRPLEIDAEDGEESTPELVTASQVRDAVSDCETKSKKVAEKLKRTIERNETRATSTSADTQITDRSSSSDNRSSRPPHDVSKTPTSARMYDLELSGGDSVELTHSPNVAVRLDRSGGGKSVVNKFEHSCNFVVQQFHGHNGAVRSISLIDDYLVTGSQDTTVKVWSISSGTELRSLGGHTQPVSGVCILSRTSSSCLVNQLLGADNDGDLTTSLSYSESERDFHLIVSVALDSTIRVWCLWSGICIKSIYTFHPLTSISFLVSKLLVICGSDGGKLEVWDLVESTGPVESVLAHEDAVTSVAVDNDYIYCGSADGLLSIYELTENRLNRIFESTDAKSSSGSSIFHRRIHCISVCDGIAYYGDDGMNIKALNWKTGIVGKLPNHTTEFGSTHGLHISNGCLVSTGYDLDNGIGYINVRSVRDGRYLYTLCDVQTGYIQCVVSSTMNNGRLAIVTGGQELKTWMPAGIDCPTNPGGEVVKSIYVSRFDKEARHSDYESDSDADDNGSSSSEQSLPWHQSEQVDSSSGWMSWCSVL